MRCMYYVMLMDAELQGLRARPALGAVSLNKPPSRVMHRVCYARRDRDETD